MQSYPYRIIEKSLNTFWQNLDVYLNKEAIDRRIIPNRFVRDMHKQVKLLLLLELNSLALNSNTAPVCMTLLQSAVFDITNSQTILMYKVRKKQDTLTDLAKYILNKKQLLEYLDNKPYLADTIEFNASENTVNLAYFIAHHNEKSCTKWLYIFQIQALVEPNFSKSYAAKSKLNQDDFLKIYDTLKDTSVYISSSDIAQRLGLGPSVFEREFKRYAQCTFNRYHTRYKMIKALHLLYFSKATTSEIANILGYTTDSFRSVFKSHFKISYTEIRKQIATVL